MKNTILRQKHSKHKHFYYFRNENDKIMRTLIEMYVHQINVR